MTDFEKEEWVELLRDDKNYYGEIGRRFISKFGYQHVSI